MGKQDLAFITEYMKAFAAAAAAGETTFKPLLVIHEGQGQEVTSAVLAGAPTAVIDKIDRVSRDAYIPWAWLGEGITSITVPLVLTVDKADNMELTTDQWAALEPCHWVTLTKENKMELGKQETFDVSTAVMSARMGQLFTKVAANLQKKATALAKELVGNFPEYGNEEWLSCCRYEYDKGEFTFRVEDPDQEGRYHDHVVTTADLALSIPLFWMAVQAGECCPYALTNSSDTDFWDAGNWDQPAVGCWLQYHFYGECVFG